MAGKRKRIGYVLLTYKVLGNEGYIPIKVFYKMEPTKGGK
jgi:hypothetical protein